MDQLGGQLGQPVDLSVSPTEFDRAVLLFDGAGFFQALTKPGHDMREGFGGRDVEEAHGRHRRILRARGERPKIRRCRRRAAESQDELAPPHSITSSARASSVGAISRPIALAALRLMTSSNVVGCWTGKSAGLAPLRILPA